MENSLLLPRFEDRPMETASDCGRAFRRSGKCKGHCFVAFTYADDGSGVGVVGADFGVG